jgi:hypothetical protein
MNQIMVSSFPNLWVPSASADTFESGALRPHLPPSFKIPAGSVNLPVLKSSHMKIELSSEFYSSAISGSSILSLSCTSLSVIVTVSSGNLQSSMTGTSGEAKGDDEDDGL